MPAEKKPVIIYGGSFDPPHRGHLALAAAALRQLRPEVLYFVPGFRTPFKDFRPLPFGERRGMLEAALRAAGLAGRRDVRISSFEAGQRRVVYTYETIAHFRRLHPGTPVYFLMGSDCLAGFTGWRRWRSVLKGARLLAGLRPGHSSAADPRVPFTPLTGRFPEAASSDLRGALFIGEKPAEMHAAVLARIKERGLYFSAEREALKGLMSTRRFLHSVETARLAIRLCGAAGVPAQKAAAAGLVHDCARDLSAAALRRRALKLFPRPPQLSEMLREAPVLLHAWVGAALAAEKFGLEDGDISEAVRLHATGSPRMGPLARLIYVSDLACHGRDFAEAGMIRELAGRDLGAAFKAANYVKLTHAFSGGGWVHPLSVGLWNILQEKKSG